MITVLVGHRGTGKTSLLRRLERISAGAAITADLDERIAVGERMSIDEIFRTRGEAAFRRLEHDYLRRFIAECEGVDRAFVAVGAGFTGPLLAGLRCLWVRRDTDGDGRIFLDRPRLDPGIDPLEEYRRRLVERETRYRTWADDVLTLGEGFERGDPAEARFFKGEAGGRVGDVMTLLPENLRRPETRDGRARFEAWAALRRALGIARFEIRDDLLGAEPIRVALASLPPEALIYSFRRPGAGRPEPWPEGIRFDWDLTLGDCPYGPPPILSLHARSEGESFEQCAARLEAAAPAGCHRKLAVEVLDFDELAAGHRWSSERPAERSFLPRSTSGRWCWYRQLFGASSSLDFVREGAGSAPDQPTLLAWLRAVDGRGRFAAVLGDPVRHSRTPAEHFEFFSAKGMPVVAISVSEEEWDRGALAILEALGLRYAAVTAPLKTRAFVPCATTTYLARELGAVNTLFFDEKTHRWHGASTDLEGLNALVDRVTSDPDHEVNLDACSIVVWGGGGTRTTLQKRFPDAAFHAARTGLRTRGPEIARPRTVIWASGRPGARPPAGWRPDLVIDLDYRENSPGRGYALQTGARYVSGLEMFRGQARAQREWWESIEDSV